MARLTDVVAPPPFSQTASYTPGPWGFGRTSDDQKMILGENGNGRYVCSVQIHQRPRQFGLLYEAEREANARLIAAAPELLAALEAIQWFCDDPNGSVKGETLAMGLGRLLPAARAAIAKAKAGAL